MITLNHNIYLNKFQLGFLLWISPCSEHPSEGAQLWTHLKMQGMMRPFFPPVCGLVFFFHLSHELPCVLVQLRLRTVAICHFSSNVYCQDSPLFLLKSWHVLLIIRSHCICICLPLLWTYVVSWYPLPSRALCSLVTSVHELYMRKELLAKVLSCFQWLCLFLSKGWGKPIM